MTIAEALRAAGDREVVARGGATAKKNYAEALSRRLAQQLADALRPSFPGVLPDPAGRGHESVARTSKGMKRLDVNYSTPQLGLGLGVSIKTINFRDAKTGRYTKNYTRADGELRAEASDYHERQPYAVLVAVVFIPRDACDDGALGGTAPSSFGQAVQVFRHRAGRSGPKDEPMRFEAVFVGLYDVSAERFGEVAFFDVTRAPPRRGPPSDAIGFAELVAAIRSVYDARNAPPFVWADAPPEPPTPLPDDDET